MLTELTVKDFIEELAADSPAPGGGSVSALAGSMAAGLLNMVLNLTVGREKFAAAEGELMPLKAETEKLYKRLTELINIDTDAFNGVMAALKLPKKTEEQKQTRAAEIQLAYKQAADIPLEVAGHCLSVLKICPAILAKGNPNSLSDAGVAVQMAYAGLQGAIMNVKINISSIQDTEYASAAAARVTVMLNEGEALRQQAMAIV
ncbi:MAG TPA: cyclodeaminase/cyclohydrolase family protein [Methylomusa anaerophila]|uniref:Methenyltetrahydrofolate cyclohydrolase n=1 Tax=Methylomusa anaerophila TaxID=1930071 RepID=A0A348AMM8_9FIRM|nr:cyclodeaminase/cyclohydrolase family protein [Methylomusa anaerophila]BBB92326.1 methenyltetrahydrofolate cyclohydrolase [Methylomusa anaerophila]HML90034.1 cyclodeaminase/cyclohydrolase family protein [Methylomusa anaerophila]